MCSMYMYLGAICIAEIFTLKALLSFDKFHLTNQSECMRSSPLCDSNPSQVQVPHVLHSKYVCPASISGNRSSPLGGHNHVIEINSCVTCSTLIILNTTMNGPYEGTVFRSLVFADAELGLSIRRCQCNTLNLIGSVLLKSEYGLKL